MDVELTAHTNNFCAFSPTRLNSISNSPGDDDLYTDGAAKHSDGGRHSDSEDFATTGDNSDEDVAIDNKMFQCSHCTYLTTDLHSIRMHVIAEHAATEGGFTEVKTEYGRDGNIVMNVNDHCVGSGGRQKGSSGTTMKEMETLVYDSKVDGSKVDNEQKVYTVL